MPRNARRSWNVPGTGILHARNKWRLRPVAGKIENLSPGTPVTRLRSAPRCAWIILFLLLGNGIGRAEPPAGYNVLLISLDTLRADHLSCYGYPRATSPHIDRVAKEGVLFENVVAASN